MENNNDGKNIWNNLKSQMLKDERTWLLLVFIVAFLISNIPKKEIIKKPIYVSDKIQKEMVETLEKETNNIKEDKKNITIDKKNEKEYKVKVHIDFTENLIFSKYDVKFKSDNGEKFLKHGEDQDIELTLKEGKRELTFISNEKSSIKEIKTIDVTSNMEIGYKINCYSDEITVEELYIDKDTKLEENQIKIDFNSSDFNEKNYKEAINKLSQLGFTNIKENPIYDIIFNITPDGEIKNVTIDGSTGYRKGDIFSKDVEIIVSYHMKDDDDPSKSKPPFDSKTASDMNYSDVKKAFEEAGFKNISLKTDITSDEEKNEKVSRIIIDSSEADKERGYDPNKEVDIHYYIYKEPEKEEPKDEYGDGKHEAMAKTAFQNAGKSLYPYGIKYHWIIGRRDFTYQGNGIWHIEVDVTITNAFNAKMDAIASGYVDFIADEVRDFNVRNKY